MPYRYVDIGNGETVVARVSDEAIEEWLGVREANKVLGYPDRPPDVDTETFRTWTLHPIEEGYTEVDESRASSGIIYTIAIPVLGGLVAKGLISYLKDGRYRFRLALRSETGITVFDDESYTDDWDEEYYEDFLEKFSTVFITDNPVEPMITTYFDYDEIESLMETVRQEIKEFYYARDDA